MKIATKVIAKYNGWNTYEITVNNKEKEIIHVTKNERKFSRNIDEIREYFAIKDIYVTGSEIKDAIQAITTKKIPEYIIRY